MHTEELLHRITRPFVLAGVYKDENVALTDIVLDYVRRKIDQYDNCIIAFQKKYDCDFDQFTERIREKASLEAEDDWMEWKGVKEMRHAWKKADKMIISSRYCEFHHQELFRI